MKLTNFVLILFLPLLCLSQIKEEKKQGLYYKLSLAGTLRVNDNYTLANDEGESFLDLNGIFVNNSVGYQFDQRTCIGVNLEYNYYTVQELNFLPIYADIRYNFITQDDNVFIRAGYGKLFSIGNEFENGTLYKIGLGYQIFDNNIRNSFLFGFDFSRKRFGFRQQDKLSSFSIFLEFMLF